MKTPFMFPKFVPMLIALGATTLSFMALGQSQNYYARADEPRRAYWNLKTDYTTNGTLIQFYDADSQLVYQESLPNQFIRLTTRNIRRLDQTLERVISNQLVATRIRTSGLMRDNSTRTKVNEVSSEKPTIQPEKPENIALQARFLLPLGIPAIHLLVDTPPEERVDLTILSADQTKVYVHRTPTGPSRHHLSFDGMPTGVYTIRVKSHQYQLQQQVMLRYENQQAVLLLKGDQVVSKR